MKLNPHDKEMAEADRERIFHGDVFPDTHPDIEMKGPNEFIKWLLILAMVLLIVWYWKIG